MDVTTIDEAKDLLYGYPVESFVAERDALVKLVRARGDRDLANLTKALRKPSAIAALVNAVARQDPAGVELILQAASLLRSAQAGALEGSGVNASELQQQYRAAVGALAQSAPDRRAEVRAALEAATIDEASNQDLRSGCLVVVPTPVSIFGETPSSPKSQPRPVDDAQTDKPFDELEERRARRQAEKTANAEAAASEAAAISKAEAKKAAAARAAAEKKAAAEAERARRAVEKERQKKLKALHKQHRDALRTHLSALDEEAAAAQDSDQADQQLIDIDADIASAEEALAALHERRSETVHQRADLDQVRADAAKRAVDAHDAVEALAELVAALEEQA